MTGFRPIKNLHAYSGGTVRDSHPVFYSPTGLLPRPQALKRNINLQKQYTRIQSKCQSKKGNTILYETNRHIQMNFASDCVYHLTIPLISGYNRYRRGASNAHNGLEL